MPRPAPRVAPATRATCPSSGRDAGGRGAGVMRHMIVNVMVNGSPRLPTAWHSWPDDRAAGDLDTVLRPRLTGAHVRRRRGRRETRRSWLAPQLRTAKA